MLSRTLPLALGLCALPLAGAAEIDWVSPVTRTPVLELYSSQGCSSCPPAERWLSRFVDSPRLWRELVPLVFHVDYWDYLGWSDPFASPAHTQRQQGYRSAGRIRSVYTPGFVYEGREWRGWFDGQSLPAATAPTVGRLRLVGGSQGLNLSFEPRLPGGQWRAHLARLGFDKRTRVPAGENAGRELRHDFVVLAESEAMGEMEAGQVRWRLALPGQPGAGREALVAWVSQDNDPAPVQALGGWLDAPTP
ncbi:MAG: DUF1223 domain-containing protein [Gammaproteobacteria bacterium]|nr:DUF1223 domain-containing protein [Gammaproteobacteria bacterium]